jgi:hypothetical protein
MLKFDPLRLRSREYAVVIENSPSDLFAPDAILAQAIGHIFYASCAISPLLCAFIDGSHSTCLGLLP